MNRCNCVWLISKILVQAQSTGMAGAFLKLLDVAIEVLQMLGVQQRHRSPPRLAWRRKQRRPRAARSPWSFAAAASRLLSRVHLFVFLPNPANCRKRNFIRNFANSERKENSNSKNEISVNSDRNFGHFDRKMMSVVIFVLFPRSNEKLLNTNFVQFFEIYNFCFRNFFI